MKSPEEILEILKANFDEAINGLMEDTQKDPTIIVDSTKILEIMQFLYDDENLSFDSLMNLSGVDDANGEKVKDEAENEIIKGGTLSVYYHLYSMGIKHKITIRTTVPREKPEIESVENIWKTADWHEREAFDMYGIIFKNHPNLIRILMPYDWEAGYPLRKDYKNPEYYKGMKVPY